MPDGGALHVWIGSEGATPYDAVYSLRARRYAANGAAGPELKLADNLGNAVQPRVAADGAGNFAVVWTQSAGYQQPYRAVRSEERRVGKESVSTCRSRWSPYH